MIDTVLKQSYAIYAGTLYRQDKGIPQGNNASPQIADLTLSMMEYSYIHKYIKASHPLAYRLSRTYRYIDDLLHVSDRVDDFLAITRDMYHDSLTLERTSRNDHSTAFLDLDITILAGNAQLSLYNKTDDYAFKVIRYPHYNSCVPVNIGINTLYGEILRIYRNCTHYNDFESRVLSLIMYFKEICYPRKVILNTLYKCLRRNPTVSLRYSISNETICSRIIG